MKDNKKNIIGDIIDIIGYTAAIGQVGVLGNILYKINKYGKAIAREPNPIIVKSEIALAGATVTFLVYKLIKNIVNRNKS